MGAPKKPNTFIKKGDLHYLKIVSPTHGEFLCLIDEDDIPLIDKHTWYITKNKVEDQFYVMATVREGDIKNNILLHRFLLKPPANMQVDHIDNNGTNNSKANLRIVTGQQNQFNKLKAKGYTWEKSRNKWRVSIYHNNKNIHIGRFDTEEAAREAYLKAKAKYHGIDFLPYDKGDIDV